MGVNCKYIFAGSGERRAARSSYEVVCYKCEALTVAIHARGSHLSQKAFKCVLCVRTRHKIYAPTLQLLFLYNKELPTAKLSQFTHSSTFCNKLFDPTQYFCRYDMFLRNYLLLAAATYHRKHSKCVFTFGRVRVWLSVVDGFGVRYLKTLFTCNEPPDRALLHLFV